MKNIQLVLDGNSGGDRIELSIAGGTVWSPREGCLSVEDALLRLTVGHCCVIDIDAVVPVEFLTGILSKVVTEQGGIEGAIRWIGWSGDFTQGLIDKVVQKP